MPSLSAFYAEIMGQFWTQLIFCALLLVTISGGDELGTTKECEDAPFVPGHNLGGEGFDVVTMERKGSYVINMEKWDLGNGTCRIHKNKYLDEVKQKLPAAVVFWRSLPKCSMKVSSRIFESSESLVSDSSSALSSSWKLGLNAMFVEGSAGATHSREAKFAMRKSKEDKYSFTKHEVACSFYRYQVAQTPPLHQEFLEAVKSLPPSYDATAYRSFISTYGTHYITDVRLGGKTKAITAINTCKASLKGLTDITIKDCLDVEASGIIKRAHVTVETHFCNEKKKKMGTGQKFSNIFSERQTEIIGGNINEEDLLFSGSSHPNSLKNWLESLKTLPDITHYTLKPLHFILSEKDPARNGLKKAVEDYINENSLRKVCSESCANGRRQSVRYECVCVCDSSQMIKSNCCPAEEGVATLKVYKLYANGLYGDVWDQTDGVVSVKFGTQIKRTVVIYNNDNPHWPETFEFGTIKINMANRLNFEVYDADSDWNSDPLGECSFALRSGVVTDTCVFTYGTFFFTYEVQCAPSLEGPQCNDYKSPMPSHLANIFSSRNGILVKDLWKLE
ncbi:perforin-1-like [Misgurnus anguillicaudatus]|uniref:perforin-1-like n=1 Tax=Misgurnus anguillicaudatus TaxID=75329 RepID=UPI003CCF0501